MSPSLPPPEGDAAVASRRLQDLICAEAEAAGGVLSFERFMELALYAPRFGYYTGGARKFGREGDFVTAPEISELFSRCLANQVAQVLNALGRGVVLEFGAGTGIMAADMLAELERCGSLPDEYLILEVSSELRERQAATLSERIPHLLAKVRWLDRLPETPVYGVMVANEVLDAFPVHRFRSTSTGIQTLRTACVGDQLQGTWVSARNEVNEAVARIAAQFPMDDGYESELCMRTAPWVEALSDCLARGLILLVDYGYPRREYYHPRRRLGTLLCHYRHLAHDDPFLYPGLQDITAHVDFTAVAEAAVGCGLEVAGFATQAHFLLGCGLEGFAGEARARGEMAWFQTAEQVKRLTLPSEMGERFKVMGLVRDLDERLSGFQLQDLRGSL